MYDAQNDPYCYPGTTILINKLDLRDQAALDAFEEEMVLTRGEEALPTGRLTVRHYSAVHRHLFQDVYGWAGEIRTVRTGRDGNWFCYPEHIEKQLKHLFGWLSGQNRLVDLAREEFVSGATHFLSELNAIHAFREGNGRAQMVFMAELARRAGHPLHLDRLDRERFIPAMIASFQSGTEPLALQLDELTRP
ncbi:Fic/DOC family protein [Salinarimonas chemoclinalis]|uniref:Fic/DOC family protein n=1 Tax=Salinarimonas chemoclinalis TaxID=3241599 RepID=UPI0035570CE7